MKYPFLNCFECKKDINPEIQLARPISLACECLISWCVECASNELKSKSNIYGLDLISIGLQCPNCNIKINPNCIQGCCIKSSEQNCKDELKICNGSDDNPDNHSSECGKKIENNYFISALDRFDKILPRRSRSSAQEIKFLQDIVQDFMKIKVISNNFKFKSNITTLNEYFARPISADDSYEKLSLKLLIAKLEEVTQKYYKNNFFSIDIINDFNDLALVVGPLQNLSFTISYFTEQAIKKINGTKNNLNRDILFSDTCSICNEKILEEGCNGPVKCVLGSCQTISCKSCAYMCVTLQDKESFNVAGVDKKNFQCITCKRFTKYKNGDVGIKKCKDEIELIFNKIAKNNPNVTKKDEKFRYSCTKIFDIYNDSVSLKNHRLLFEASDMDTINDKRISPFVTDYYKLQLARLYEMYELTHKGNVCQDKSCQCHNYIGQNSYLPIGPLKNIEFFRNTFLEFIIKFQNNSLNESIFDINLIQANKDNINKNLNKNNENKDKTDTTRKINASLNLNKKDRINNNDDNNENEFKKLKNIEDKEMIKQNNIIYNEVKVNKNIEELEKSISTQIPENIFTYINKSILNLDSNTKYYDYNKNEIEIIRIVYFGITNHNGEYIPLDCNININGGYLLGFIFHPTEDMHPLEEVEFNNWMVDDGKIGLINIEKNGSKVPIYENAKEKQTILIQDKYNSQRWYQVVQPVDNYKRIYIKSSYFFQYFIGILKLAPSCYECNCFDLLELNKESDRKLIEFNKSMIIDYLLKLGYDKNSTFLKSISSLKSSSSSSISFFSSSLPSSLSNQNNSIFNEFTNNTRDIDNNEVINYKIIDENNSLFSTSINQDITNDMKLVKKDSKLDSRRDDKINSKIDLIDRDIDIDKDSNELPPISFNSYLNQVINTSSPILLNKVLNKDTDLDRNMDQTVQSNGNEFKLPMKTLERNRINEETYDDLQYSIFGDNSNDERNNDNDIDTNEVINLTITPCFQSNSTTTTNASIVMTTDEIHAKVMPDNDIEKSSVRFSKMKSFKNPFSPLPSSLIANQTTTKAANFVQEIETENIRIKPFITSNVPLIVPSLTNQTTTNIIKLANITNNNNNVDEVYFDYLSSEDDDEDFKQIIQHPNKKIKIENLNLAKIESLELASLNFSKIRPFKNPFPPLIIQPSSIQPIRSCNYIKNGYN